MAVFDEPLTNLINAIGAWDFSAAIPSNYDGPYQVQIEHGTPYQIMQRIQTLSGGQMTTYLISIQESSSLDTVVRLGDVFGDGDAPGTTRYGRRMSIPYVLSAWADERLGGMDAARLLAGQLVFCALFNKTRLQSPKNLRVKSPRPMVVGGSQLYRYDVTVEGDVVYAVDY